MKLSIRNAVSITEAFKQHEHNFELTLKFKGGKRVSTGNFVSQVEQLSHHLRFSQIDSNSIIQSFEIAKVQRDKAGNIIQYDLIVASIIH